MQTLKSAITQAGPLLNNPMRCIRKKQPIIMALQITTVNQWANYLKRHRASHSTKLRLTSWSYPVLAVCPESLPLIFRAMRVQDLRSDFAENSVKAQFPYTRSQLTNFSDVVFFDILS